MRLIFLAPVLLVPVLAAHAQPRPPAPHAGTTYELTTDRTTEFRGNGSSGTSQDRDILVERIIAIRDGGTELEYDLPQQTSPQDRAKVWQFPARVFKPAQGPLVLLNGPELDARIDAWLKRASIPRDACGHWIFTWNAFQIDCDPKSVLHALDQVASTPGHLHDGDPYQDPAAIEPAPLKRTASAPTGETFTVDMQVDTNPVRRERAKSDVAVGEIEKKPISLEAALRQHEADRVSGTIAVTVQTGPDGQVRRRTRLLTTTVTAPDGRSETSIVTETLTRRPLPPSTRSNPALHR